MIKIWILILTIIHELSHASVNESINDPYSLSLSPSLAPTLSPFQSMPSSPLQLFSPSINQPSPSSSLQSFSLFPLTYSSDSQNFNFLNSLENAGDIISLILSWNNSADQHSFFKTCHLSKQMFKNYPSLNRIIRFNYEKNANELSFSKLVDNLFKMGFSSYIDLIMDKFQNLHINDQNSINTLKNNNEFDLFCENLSGINWEVLSTEASQFLGRILNHTKKLTHLTIRSQGRIASVGQTAIIKNLKLNPLIVELNFPYLALDSTAANLLAGSMKYMPFLEKLDISNNKIMGNDAYINIIENLIHCTHLKKLILSQTDIVNNIATALSHTLKKTTAMEILDMSGNKMMGGGLYDIMASIQFLLNLTELDFTWDDMNMNSAQILGNSLAFNSNLKSLNLSFNQHMENRHGLIMAALFHNKGLTYLDLTQTQFITDASHEIKLMMSGVIHLKSLKVGGNTKMDGANQLAIIDGLQYTPQLTTLELNDIRMIEQAALQLGQMMQIKNDMAFIPYLSHFNISHNSLSKNSLCSLIHGLDKRSHLISINFTNTNMGSDIANLLLSYAKKMDNIKEIKAGSNPQIDDPTIKQNFKDLFNERKMKSSSIGCAQINFNEQKMKNSLIEFPQTNSNS
jgi:hypothetical protein